MFAYRAAGKRKRVVIDSKEGSMRVHIPLLATGLLILSSASLPAASVTGNWFTHKAKSIVKITRCGAGVCGRIVWLRKALNSEGHPVRDERNRNERYRGRKVLGLRTFSGLKRAGPRLWSGLLYNPDDGRTYQGSITLLDASSIRVEGCRLGGGACGGRRWTRAQ